MCRREARTWHAICVVLTGYPLVVPLPTHSHTLLRYDDEDEEEIDLSVPVQTRAERMVALAPMKLLLEAIDTRFRYHFSGRKETNRIDKPEWMFTFVLNTLKEHEEFIAASIQPVLDDHHYAIDATVWDSDSECFALRLLNGS